MSTSNMNQGQLVNNIKSLQTLEQELYLDLEKIPTDESSIEAQKDLVNRINTASQSRLGLYSQVNFMYTLLNNNVTNEREDLNEQLKIIKVAENQLNKTKQLINKNKNLNNNSLRLLEINTYYSNQYNAYNSILRVVVYLCLPLLILGILRQYGLLSSRISNILGILILTIGVLFILSKISDLYMRDNMVFNEYGQLYQVDVDNQNNTTIIEQDGQSLSLMGEGSKYLHDLELLEKGDCLGASCCSSGQIFKDNKCVLP